MPVSTLKHFETAREIAEKTTSKTDNSDQAKQCIAGHIRCPGPDSHRPNCADCQKIERFTERAREIWVDEQRLFSSEGVDR